MIEPLRHKSQEVLSFYPIILYDVSMETVAEKLRRLSNERAAEIRQAQKEGNKVKYLQEEEDGLTVEEILADPTKVFNGQPPTKEEVESAVKKYARR